MADEGSSSQYSPVSPPISYASSLLHALSIAPSESYVFSSLESQFSNPSWLRQNWLKFMVTVGILIVSAIVLFVARENHFKDERFRDCQILFRVGWNKNKNDFSYISEAVDSLPSYSPYKSCIFIRKGEYLESVVIGHDKTNLVLIGEGAGRTNIIASNVSNGVSSQTWPFATLRVMGDGFMARDLTVRNEADQGVAVENRGYRSIFYLCSLEGRSATLIAFTSSQFYDGCQIRGGTGLINGDAAAVFQRCNIYSGIGSYSGEDIFIAIHSRDSLHLATGFVFHLCSFFGTKGSDTSTTRAFIGRASGKYARIVVMQSYLDASIAGYVDSRKFASISDTMFFAAFDNNGPGATLEKSHDFVLHISSKEVASQFSLREFLKGKTWLPSHVAYNLDLA